MDTLSYGSKRRSSTLYEGSHLLPLSSTASAGRVNTPAEASRVLLVQERGKGMCSQDFPPGSGTG